jgi:perosamine synthetase
MADETFLPLLAVGSNYPPARLSMLARGPHHAGRSADPADAQARIDADPDPDANADANADAAGPVPSAFLNQGRSYHLGRYALAEALRRAGAGPGRAVWMPAMHCRTMPEAAQYLGAPVRYYPMTAQLRPDFDALASLLAASTEPAAALVQVHYFGFPQGLDEVLALCRQHRLQLVEDCSHAFYGQDRAPGGSGLVLGEVGDYAVTSTWKFHPVPFGAVLLDHTAQGQNRHRGAPWMHEARSVAAWTSKRIKRIKNEPVATPPDPQAAQRVGPLLETALRLAAAQHLVAGPAVSAFKASLAQAGAPRLYQWLVRRADHASIASRRRTHFRHWLAALPGVPGITPLFPSLPDGVVPYAFPLLADEAGVLFHLLKLAGVPVWRWEDMSTSAAQQCAVTASYRVRLLQLACHQNLNEHDLAWMAQTLVACANLLPPSQNGPQQSVRSGAAEL